MAKLLRFDGGEDTVQPADPKKGFTLEEAYTLIGCDTVQLIRAGRNGWLLFDENGKFKPDWQSRINERASAILHESGGVPWDYITGHALLCDRREWR